MPNVDAAITANKIIKGIASTIGETASNKMERLFMCSSEVLAPYFFSKQKRSM